MSDRHPRISSSRPQKPQGLLGTGKMGKGDVEVGEEGDYIAIILVVTV